MLDWIETVQKPDAGPQSNQTKATIRYSLDTMGAARTVHIDQYKCGNVCWIGLKRMDCLPTGRLRLTRITPLALALFLALLHTDDLNTDYTD